MSFSSHAYRPSNHLLEWAKNSPRSLPSATTHRSAPVDDRSGAGGEIPRILNICAHLSPSPAVPSTLCRLPLVILQQAAQSFPAPHCSRVPSCLRLRYNWLPLSTASLRRELFRSTRRNLHRFLGTERNTPFRFRDHLVPTYLVSLFNLPLPDWVPFPVGIRIRLSPH